MKSFKIILVLSLPLILIIGCKKSDDSTSTSSTAQTTSVLNCSSTGSSAGVVAKVGDNSSNKVTTALAKSANYSKGLTVFGINILATSEVSDEKLLHAANITAELIDNNEDGTADNPTVLKALVDNSTYVGMQNLAEGNSITVNSDPLDNAGAGQHTSLRAFETGDNYADGVRHDASIEEIFHLITQYGYSVAYLTVFEESNTSTSTMALAMDTARGGRQLTTTDGAWVYNNSSCPSSGSVESGKAWYFYSDSSADYKTMQTEYMYWSVSSKFGMHDSTAGRTKTDSEWCPNTKAELLAQDPTIYNLIDNATYAFPTVLPDASYSACAFTTSDIITF